MTMFRSIALFVVLGLVWALAAGYLALQGTWMAPAVAPGDSAAFGRWAADRIEADNRGAAALVLLESGTVAATHYQPEGVTNGDTLFPTASFSKLVTALGVLALQDAGQLDLDAPVSRYLSRWQLPDSEFDHSQVTIRRLLSHTAGLTDGLGFGDYGAEETLPGTVAELHAPRASSGTRQIRVGVEPGSEFRYSGGGYLMLQLVIEEISGVPFAEHIQKTVLTPLGLRRSNYAAPGTRPNSAHSFHLDGSRAPDFQYAAPAATGLNSTANDLTLLARALLTPAYRPLRQPEAHTLGAAIWGPGAILYAPTPNGDQVFGHDGSNEPALNATLRINPERGDALIVLVSGNPRLASAIGGEWVLWQTGLPDLFSLERALGSAVLPLVLGLVAVLGFVVWLRVRWRRRQAAPRASS